MKILAPYISGIFIRNFVLAVLGLTFLIFLQAALGQLIDGKFPPNQVLLYNLMGIPQSFVEVVPPSVLMATVLTLSGLNRTNELIACYSIGVSTRQVMGVVFSIVFMISCLSLVMQDRILPPIFKKKTNYYWRDMKKRSDFFLDVRKDKIWYRSKNLIYNLRTFDPNSKTIYGMAVYTFDSNFDLVQVVDAGEAQYTPQGWKLRKGTVTVFTEQDRFPMSQKFEEKNLIISETPKDFQEIEKEVDGLRLKELHQYINRTQESGVNTKNYEIKFHSKISLSFIPLVMALLAVPFSTRLRREGGLGKDLLTCLGFTVFYWIFYVIGLSFGKSNTVHPVFAAWVPSIIFLILALVLTYRARKV